MLQAPRPQPKAWRRLNIERAKTCPMTARIFAVTGWAAEMPTADDRNPELEEIVRNRCAKADLCAPVWPDTTLHELVALACRDTAVTKRLFAQLSFSAPSTGEELLVKVGFGFLSNASAGGSGVGHVHVEAVSDSKRKRGRDDEVEHTADESSQLKLKITQHSGDALVTVADAKIPSGAPLLLTLCRRTRPVPVAEDVQKTAATCD